MKDIILKLENISKQYRLGLVGTGSLRHDINRSWHKIRGKADPYLDVGSVNDRSVKADDNYVWALKDINFEVERGEILGIIGKNGAGKSTLLKLLSRVTTPTTGVIKSGGRIASLLEVGTGFHPELTGLENIYLNGAILGMTKAEIKSKLDEIVAFSGCEKYIDTPVKRYSSGMTVRLGFAVAAHLDPDILVVDEVLAVGDAEFQKKAIGKMQEISSGGGRTVLFVSHNMGSVKALCNRSILLSNGMIAFNGSTTDAIKAYLSSNEDLAKQGIANFRNKHLGDSSLRLLEVESLDADGKTRSTFIQSEPIKVRIVFEILEPLFGMRCNLKVKTPQQEDVFMTSSHMITKELDRTGVFSLELTIPAFLLNSKRYLLSLNFGIPGNRVIVPPIDALSIDIEGENAGGSDFVERWPGLVAPKIDWKFII